MRLIRQHANPAALRRRRSMGRSGVAFVEFALSAPLVVVLGMAGSEIANLALTHMRISQVALSLADNASRIGTASDLSEKQVQEREINEILGAANMQAGSLGLLTHGRVVLSSLQVNADDGQWIAWQRCKGLKRADSTFGVQGDGRTGKSLQGMGPAGKKIKAVAGSAVMFVEVTYDYQPIVGTHFIKPQILHYTAAFTVRDKRNLTKVYNAAPAAVRSRCDTYTV